MVEVRAGYLKHPCGSHTIYFRDNGDRIEIIRILHNKQDVERHLDTLIYPGSDGVVA